ncbi:hypothetical protein B0H19DRAFT_1257410 [Mycena capillaripes]|nr:hypothetical protein B0H19DRAFT_1257410 [Mycena capillaripes]
MPDKGLLRVLLSCGIYRHVYDYIAVHEFQLATRQSREVLKNFIPSLRKMVSISTDFLLYTSGASITQTTTLVLVNWRTSMYVLLNYGLSSAFLGHHCVHPVTLLPGYIAATYPNSAFPHQLYLVVTALDSLAPHYKPLDTFSLTDELSLRDLSFVAHERLERDGRPIVDSIQYVRLAVLSSALHRDSDNISVHIAECTMGRRSLGTRVRHLVTGMIRSPAAGPVLVSDRLSPPGALGKPCGWRLISAVYAISAIRVADQPPLGTVVERKDSSIVVYYYG